MARNVANRKAVRSVRLFHPTVGAALYVGCICLAQIAIAITRCLYVVLMKCAALLITYDILNAKCYSSYELYGFAESDAFHGLVELVKADVSHVTFSTRTQHRKQHVTKRSHLYERTMRIR